MTGSERQSGGFVRRTGQAAIAVERFDLKGGKTPEGEWRSQERLAGPCGISCNGLEATKQPRLVVAPPAKVVVEPKGRTGGGTAWEEGAK